MLKPYISLCRATNGLKKKSVDSSQFLKFKQSVAHREFVWSHGRHNLLIQGRLNSFEKSKALNRVVTMLDAKSWKMRQAARIKNIDLQNKIILGARL